MTKLLAASNERETCKSMYIVQIFLSKLTESRIPLKLVLGGVRIVALSIRSHEQTQ